MCLNMNMEKEKKNWEMRATTFFTALHVGGSDNILNCFRSWECHLTKKQQHMTFRSHGDEQWGVALYKEECVSQWHSDKIWKTSWGAPLRNCKVGLTLFWVGEYLALRYCSLFFAAIAYLGSILIRAKNIYTMFVNGLSDVKKWKIKPELVFWGERHPLTTLWILFLMFGRSDRSFTFVLFHIFKISPGHPSARLCRRAVCKWGRKTDSSWDCFQPFLENLYYCLIENNSHIDGTPVFHRLKCT